jgi:hypothetical protein
VYGLDADDILSTFYGIGDLDEARFHRGAMNPREIIMRLVITPLWELGESYSDVRDTLYRAISRNRSRDLEIVLRSSTTKVASIQGRISKFEVPLFNKDAEVQITFQCEDPFFRSTANREYLASDFDATGYISLYDATSTAPHGLEMEVTFNQTATEFVVADDDPFNWRFYVDAPVADPFVAGDVLYISSEEGSKTIRRDRGGTITYLMDLLLPGSSWPILFPGENEYYMPGLIPTADYTIDYIKFKAVYWGV